MKRKYINTLNTPRKKRKYNVNDINYENNTINIMNNMNNNNNNNDNNNNNTKMVCVICLSEMPSQSLHEHYSKYHNELLVSTTSKFTNVIQKCKDNNDETDHNINNNNKILYGDNDNFRLKLQLLHKEENKKNKHKKNKVKIKHRNKNKNNNKINNNNNNKKKKNKNKPIKFNVPRFELNTNRKEEELTDIFDKLITNKSVSTDVRPLITNNTGNIKTTGYESIINSLMLFENNTHSLNNLLSDSTIIPSNVSQCKLLIKILFEQLWNARIICDEQILFIKYINMIDVANRMQISFILNQLKQNHNNIYDHLYKQLQLNQNWQNWKNLRFNDNKINYLRENINKIKENNNNNNSNNNNNKQNYNNINNIQLNTIYSLKNKQSANIQKYDLNNTDNIDINNEINHEINNEINNDIETDNNNNNNNFFTKYKFKKMRSEFDLSEALASVDSINAPTHKAPKPDIIDLSNNNNNNNSAAIQNEDDEKWMFIIKKLLNEFKSTMDLTEINDKLDSLRYCSEFDVLNDMLCINKINNSQQIKLRFCHYFGNLSEWKTKRLIKWCQTNKFYQICQKIRSKQINGKQFIDIVTDITSVQQFFNNLTSPQIIQIYNRINHYFEDALSIL